jgi:hypothetical protein
MLDYLPGHPKSLARLKHHRVHFPTSANSRSAVSNTLLSNKHYKIKPMIILHGNIVIMNTTIFPDHENDFMPLRTVSMLNLPENAHFDLLKVIRKESNQWLINSAITYKILL